MSRIGKKPISIPASVNVSIQDNVITVKGPKGQLSQQLTGGIEAQVESNTITFTRNSDLRDVRALHGLYRNLVYNMVVGVTEGYERKLELIGIGYKTEAKGQVLELSIGYSHPVYFVLPPEISVSTETLKGQAPRITLKGIDKQLIGQVAAKIRAIRPPEPYKGKGIKLTTEVVRRKQGKASGKKK